MTAFIHPTAVVEPGVSLGDDVKIWHFSHVRNNAVIGSHVSIAKDVYVDANVTIGEGSRIQNGVNIYNGVKISRWCFVGPAVVFTNDMHPRVGRNNWQITPTMLEDGSSIGAGAIVRCGVTIGAFAMVGAGAVVTKDIPPFCLVTGVPADLSHRICACGDQVLPLMSWVGDVILSCCEKNLEPEVLKVARNIVEGLKKHPLNKVA
ncbi:MAG: N-acetyltransferase [Bdellovibrionaceae bacterium]|nr:N-acetyltransferase [Pseudobdellovibrionaceae bacterium]